jgi:hypothetical protein
MSARAFGVRQCPGALGQEQTGLDMNDTAKLRGALLSVACAVAGGVLGYFAFVWIARQGFYALMLPGGLAGLGASVLAKDRSVPRAVICGLFALGLGLVAEWKFAPFIADSSLGYFLAHVHQLRPITLLMIAGGAFLGYWLALGRETGSGVGRPADRQP